MTKETESEQVALMPVERSYDIRVKQIIAFNECRRAGGNLDDALEAAYKVALRYTPSPVEQPAPAAVVMIEAIERTRSLLANKNYTMGVDECIAIIKEVARLNGEKP